MVEEVMTPREKLVFVKPHETAVDAFYKFSRSDVGRLPVLEEDKDGWDCYSKRYL
jgi:CBS domain-containing protein